MTKKELNLNEIKNNKVNIGTIGHVDHGKTTLTAAITKVFTDVFGGENTSLELKDIDRTRVERERGITINATSVSYHTSKKLCTHVDCPGHKDFIKNFITGIKPMEAAILLVDSKLGFGPQTHEHLRLAHRKQIKHLAVFLSKADVASEEEITVSRMEAEQALQDQGYDLNSVTFIVGSAIAALEGQRKEDIGETAILQIADFIDNLPDFDRDYEGPFKMPVDSTASISGRGTVLTGTIKRGKVVKDQVVDIVYGSKILAGRVITEVQSFRKTIEAGTAGSSVGVLVRGLAPTDVKSGATIYKPGTYTLADEFTCNLYVGTTSDGQRGRSFTPKFSPQFIFGFNDTVTGEILEIHKTDEEGVVHKVQSADAGNYYEIKVKLIRPTSFDTYDQQKEKILVKEGDTTVGAGTIVSLSPMKP